MIRPRLRLLLLLGMGCNGVCGLDDVQVSTGGAGASGAGASGASTSAGGSETGGATVGGSGGSGAAGGGAGGAGGGGGWSPKLCGPVPDDNIVQDGSFNEAIGDPWYAYNAELVQVQASGDNGCDGEYYLELTDWQNIGTAWGTGTWQVLSDANTPCVEWSYSARPILNEVYTRITLIYEPPGPAESLTGEDGIYAQADEWTLYQGACRLTPPTGAVVDYISVHLSISEDPPGVNDDVRALFDAVVIRPIECTLATPDCFPVP